MQASVRSSLRIFSNWLTRSTHSEISSRVTSDSTWRRRVAESPYLPLLEPERSQKHYAVWTTREYR